MLTATTTRHRKWGKLKSERETRRAVSSNAKTHQTLHEYALTHTHTQTLVRTNTYVVAAAYAYEFHPFTTLGIK